jgi:hypothetical protein
MIGVREYDVGLAGHSAKGGDGRRKEIRDLYRNDSQFS